MFYMYVLVDKGKNIYIGYTSNLRQRFKDHQCGRVASTRMGRPWKLAYYEAYCAESDARSREKLLKHYGSTLGQLKKRIQRSLLM